MSAKNCITSMYGYLVVFNFCNIQPLLALCGLDDL